MMDPVAIAAAVVALLTPYLAEGGKAAAKKASEALVAALERRFKNQPAAKEAVKDLKVSPQDSDAQAALRLQLRNTLAADPEFLAELARLLEEAKAETPVAVYQAMLKGTGAIALDHGVAARQVAVGHDVYGDVVLIADPNLPAPQPRPKIYHNLPNRDYGQFIGRKEELKQLRKLLSPQNRAWVIVIDGIGGIGKSALALEAAHRYLLEFDELPEEERFQAIIWTSAKAATLTANGIAPRQQITRTLDDICTTIAITLQREDITRARPEEQGEIVRRALTRQRNLIIIDNLETIDDERVNAFLRELPAPTKCIVTTRHRIDVAYPISLTEMPHEDALILIAQECEKKRVTLTDKETDRLYQRTGGVPLAIVWSVAQMGYGYGVEAVLHRLGTPTGDIARYCFEGAMEHIRGRLAHKLLMALSLFAIDANRKALGNVAGLPELDRDEGLVELENLSLAMRLEGRFRLLPLTRSYVHHHLEESRETERLRRSFVDYFLGFARTHGTQEDWLGSFPWENLELLKAEYSNLIQAAYWSYELGRWSDCVDLEYRLFLSLAFHGHWTERIELVHLALKAIEHLPEREKWKEHRARLLIDSLGWVYCNQGHFREMREVIKTGLSFARSLTKPNWDLIAIAECYMSVAHSAEGNLGTSRERLERVLSIQGRLHPSTVARVRSYVGDILVKEGQLDAAHRQYAKALEIRERVGELIGAATSQLQLADIEFDLGNYDRARELYISSKALTERYGRQVNLAHELGPVGCHINFGLAKIARLDEEWAQALQLANRALSVFEHLDMQKEAADIQQFIAEVSIDAKGNGKDI